MALEIRGDLVPARKVGDGKGGVGARLRGAATAARGDGENEECKARNRVKAGHASSWHGIVPAAMEGHDKTLPQELPTARPN